MAKPKSTKRLPYTDDEVAFIIVYADYCIQIGADYNKTLAAELHKATGRFRDPEVLRHKTKSIINQYRKTNNVKPSDLSKQGTSCLDMGKMTDAIVTRVNSHRSEWELNSSADDSVASSAGFKSAIDGAVGTTEDEDNSERHSIAKSRAKLPRMEDSQECTPSPPPRTAMQTTDNDTVDHMSDSATSFSQESSSATERTSPIVSKKRPSEPVDRIAPPLKRAKHPQVLTETNNRKRAAVAMVDSEEKSEKEISVDKPHLGTGDAPYGDRAISVKPHKSSLPSQRPAKAPASSTQMSDHKERKQGPTPSATFVDDKRAKSSTGHDNIIRLQNHGDSDADLFTNSKRRHVHTSKDTTYVEVLEEEVKGLKQQCKMNLELTHWLMRRILETGEDLSADENEQIRSIIRTVERHPNEFFDKLMQDLRSERALKVEYRTGLKKTIGDLKMGPKFPKPLDYDEVRLNWKGFKDHIVWAVGRGLKTPTPSLTASAFLSARIEDIAYGRVMEDQLQSCIEDVCEFLVSPHAQQSLLSALFCHWIFESPEWMCKDMHNDTSLTMLEAIRSSNSLNEVEHFDKASFQLLTHLPQFQERRMEPRKRNFLKSFDKAISSFCTPRAVNDRSWNISPNDFAESAIELKKTLMLAPSNYRIHYARPGMKFDGSWMVPIDSEHWEIKDRVAKDKHVALCLFPALAEENLPDFEEDAPIDLAFMMNKNFYPMFGEKATGDKKRVVCKAYVLISNYKRGKSVADASASHEGYEQEEDDKEL